MYDIYKKDFLKHINITNIKSKLLAYIIKDDDLSYEITGKKRDFIFITGYNQEEKELPMFDHPVLIEGLMGKSYIAIDLRKYLKTNLKEKPLLLKQELNNYSYGMFSINRTIITDIYLDDKTKLGVLQDPISTIFAMIVSTYIEMMVSLTPKEKIQIEAVSYIYACSMFLENYSNDERKSYFKAKLKTVKLSFPLLNENIEEVINCNINATTFVHLFESIGYLIGEKKQGININSFINSITSLWYGPGTVETTLLSLSDLPTMISLYYSALSDSSLRKSRVSVIIERFKKKLDMDKINKLTQNIKSYNL